MKDYFITGAVVGILLMLISKGYKTEFQNEAAMMFTVGFAIAILSIALCIVSDFVK